MKRREFLEKAGVGSAAFVSVSAAGSAANTANADAQQEDHGHGNDAPAPSGPLASATVSFGAWASDGYDRFPNVSNRLKNVHQLIPNEVTIKAGGTVNFNISGFHQVLVYAPGTKPEDIDISLTVPNLAPPRINDPVNRVYRGLDPGSLLMPALPSPPFPAPPVPPPPPPFPLQSIQDRVEVVHFANPGRYLVLCGILPHFFEQGVGFVMYGYVRVIE